MSEVPPSPAFLCARQLGTLPAPPPWWVGAAPGVRIHLERAGQHLSNRVFWNPGSYRMFTLVHLKIWPGRQALESKTQQRSF